MHGESGEEEKNVTVFQLLSSCPIVTDESGKESTFSIGGQSLYSNGPMPWSAYLNIHGTMFNLVKSTGLRDLSVLYNVDNASGYLPALCIFGLTCAESGECVKFEAKMVEFVNEQLIPEARVKVFTAFPQIGYASTKGSISLWFQVERVDGGGIL